MIQDILTFITVFFAAVYTIFSFVKPFIRKDRGKPYSEGGCNACYSKCHT